MSDTQVVIIGAGPQGLSISAHLSALGVDHLIVGRTNNTYRSIVPDGMLMKSEPYASSIASPDGKHSLAAFSAAHGLDYVDRIGPVTAERFVEYVDWYAERLVPGVQDETVTEVTPVDEGFRVSFADAAPVTAGQVVVATGVLPYYYLPTQLAELPDHLITHTARHIALDEFKGRKVVVVGAGQSALETAALLHETGADVQVIVRAPQLSWNEKNPDYVSTLGQVKRPVVQLCEGWRCAFWNAPAAFRMLPEGYRIQKARTVLGPSGAWWLKDRVDGKIEVLGNTRLISATSQGSGLRLTLDGPGPDALDVDHVIAGTGFRVDLARLPFLPEEVRARIGTVNGYPVVDRVGQSTVPGLYFMGSPSSLSLGPSVRFIAGTHNVASKLAKSLSGRRPASAPRVPAAPQPARDGVTA